MKIKFKVSECSCSTCASMCKNPCVPTPEEAQELINRGHKDNLIVWTSYYQKLSGIQVVRPRQNESSDERGCVYFNRVTRKCLLHDLNLKPLEGRLAHHAPSRSEDQTTHEYVCSRWESPLGRELVNFIQELHKERNEA